MLRTIALVSLASLLAVWVAYPLVIRLLAALLRLKRGVSRSGVTVQPSVSVLIATREDAATTRRRIANILSSAYDPTKLEVVVALDRNGGRACPSDFITLPPNVHTIEGDFPGRKAATLNAAVRASRGDVLVFADVHQDFAPEAIDHLVGALAAPDVGAVSGCLDLPQRGRGRSLAERYWLAERWLRQYEAAVRSSVGVTGAIWAMRRTLWSPLPVDLINDDMYAPMQVVLRGYRVGFVPEARAIDTRRHAPHQEYARKVRTLTGVVQLCSWLPDVLNPLRNPIWTQFVIHKLLRLLTPYWLLAIAIWLTVELARLLAAHWSLATVFLAASAGAAYVARSRLAALVRETVVPGALLQAATIVGTVNGVRRRWDVWQ